MNRTLYASPVEDQLDLLAELRDAEAERIVLAAMMTESATAVRVASALDYTDFMDTQHALCFEAMRRLLRGVEPMDAEGVVNMVDIVQREEREFRRTEPLTKEFVFSLALEPVEKVAHVDAYAARVVNRSWLRRFGRFLRWGVERLSDKPDFDSLYQEAYEQFNALRPPRKEGVLVEGLESLGLHESDIRQRVKEEREGTVRRMLWPWASWNRQGRMRPMRAGDLYALHGGTGMGKSIIGDCIAESLAQQGYQVVLVHLEDGHQKKFDRRMARHARIDITRIEDGALSDEELGVMADAKRRMAPWLANMRYLHKPGASVDEIAADLIALQEQGLCDVVVLDYLNKLRATPGQVRLFGDNVWERMADNVERLKLFAERPEHAVPVFILMQSGEDGKLFGSKQIRHKVQAMIAFRREVAGPNGLYDSRGNLLAAEGEKSPIGKFTIEKQNQGQEASWDMYVDGKHMDILELSAA